MKINILIGEADLKWILGRLAIELHEKLGYSINEEGADVDYCLPYLMYLDSNAPIKVPLFTHREVKMQAKRDAFDSVAELAPVSICLSETTKNELPFNAKEVSQVIHLASDLHKQPIFGLVGKNHLSGRKNFDWVTELRKEFIMFHKVLGEDLEEREEFYKAINYLVITSSIEGGPVPFLDALAMGIPVISGDVGWCWQYPCIHYEKDNLDSLVKILRQLNKPRTWENVAQDHKQFFKGIIWNTI